MLKSFSLSLLLVFCVAEARAQWAEQPSGVGVRLRGVSAVSRMVAWASGAGGTYLRTTDGGRSWRAGLVPDAEGSDFRDVDAFDADTAFLLSIGEGEKSRFYKTTDGGLHWTLQFQNRRPGAFFDCMAFWDRAHGIAISDPVDGRFLVVTTDDGGRTWREMDAVRMPPAQTGEGAFAASGTCVAVEGTSNVWFGTGGPAGARVFRSSDGGRAWDVSTAPLANGKSAGVFSLAFWDARHGVAVGGDYTKEQDAAGNAALTTDGGKTWQPVGDKRPNGYRSCVAVIRGTRRSTLVAVGPSGSDYSNDGGRAWSALGAEGFHSMSVARSGDIAWAVGEGGHVARLDAPSRPGRTGRRARWKVSHIAHVKGSSSCIVRAMYPALNPSDAAGFVGGGEAGRFQERQNHWLEVFARLRNGVSREQAGAELATVARRVAETNFGKVEAETLRRAQLLKMSGGMDPSDREEVLPVAWLVMGVMALVLLIACANIAGLLVARAAVRRRETAIRQALGASRPRLVRQWLTESVLLGVVGGALGLLLALWVRAYRVTLPLDYLGGSHAQAGRQASSGHARHAHPQGAQLRPAPRLRRRAAHHADV